MITKKQLVCLLLLTFTTVTTSVAQQTLLQRIQNNPIKTAIGVICIYVGIDGIDLINTIRNSDKKYIREIREEDEAFIKWWGQGTLLTDEQILMAKPLVLAICGSMILVFTSIGVTLLYKVYSA